MAQVIVLAAGQTAATSDDIVVARDSGAKVGLFATGAIPHAAHLTLVEATPGGDSPVAQLSAANRSVVISAPGTYRVARPSIAHLGVDVGVYTD